jgi:hypothetical protein
VVHVRAGQHQPAVPAVTVAQGAGQRDRERPVLVRVVGADADQQASPLGDAVRLARRRRRLGPEAFRPGGDRVRALGRDQVLAQRVLARVAGREHRHVGRGEREARDATEVLPALGALVVVAAAVGDQVVVGDHDALAEQRQQGQVAGPEDLLRAVHDVGQRHAGDGLLIEHQLDRRVGLEQRQHLRRGVVGQDDAQAHRRLARERRDQIEDVGPRPRRGRAERTGIDGDAQRSKRRLGARDRAPQRPRVALQQLLVRARANADRVGEDVHEPVGRDASRQLGDRILVGAARGRRSDQLERLGAQVAAVATRPGDRGVHSRGRVAHRAGERLDVARIAGGSRQRARGHRNRIGVHRLAQAVEPARSDQHALADQRQVGMRRARVDRTQRGGHATLPPEGQQRDIARDLERAQRRGVGVRAGQDQRHAGGGVGAQLAQRLTQRGTGAGGHHHHHRGAATIADRLARSQRTHAHAG